jgi:hypothetical protein
LGGGHRAIEREKICGRKLAIERLCNLLSHRRQFRVQVTWLAMSPKFIALTRPMPIGYDSVKRFAGALNQIIAPRKSLLILALRSVALASGQVAE